MISVSDLLAELGRVADALDANARNLEALAGKPRAADRLQLARQEAARVQGRAVLLRCLLRRATCTQKGA